jgi:aspartate aminotransferase-like enzyme
MTEAAKHPRLWIPGPVEVDAEVLSVMATPMVGHRGPEFKALYEACQPGLKAIFGTERPVFVATASATGVMEGCVRNLVKKKSLHLVNGAFSERWFEIAKDCGREPIKIEVEWGKALRAPMLEEALQKNPDVECVFITHSETSTGVLNPLFELAAVVRQRPKLLLCVDAVSSLSTTPVDVDKNRIDVLLAGTQKGLGLPPGLAVFHVSDRAMAVAKEMPGRGHYFDFLSYQKAHELGSTPCTPAVSLFYALRVQLERIMREGLDARYRRHWTMAARVRAWALERLGLFPEEGYATYGLTCIKNTKDFDWKKLDAEMRKRGHVLGDGYGKLKQKTFRIAHMGDVTLDEVENVLEQLNEVMGL